MAMFDKPFGESLRGLLNKVVGDTPKVDSKGLSPGTMGYVQEVFDTPIKEGYKAQPDRSGGLRYGQIQVRQKVAKKGSRMTKRPRLEGPRARW